MKLLGKKKKRDLKSEQMGKIFFPKGCACQAVRFQILGRACEYCCLVDLLVYYHAIQEQNNKEIKQLKLLSGGLKDWVNMHRAICEARLPEGKEDALLNALNVYLMKNVIHSNKWHKRLALWHCCLPMKKLDQDFHQCRRCRFVKLTAGFKRSIGPKDPTVNMNRPEPVKASNITEVPRREHEDS